jgi:integrase
MEVPTLEAFAPRFVDGHARANRHKPSGIATIESILKWQLVPTLGPKRLDAITNEQVQRLKLALSDRAPKTVNNVLTVLSTLLKKAVERGELDRLPCTVKLLPYPKKTMGFHDFDQYERLLRVARSRGTDAYVMVLLGGDAGLRLGEIIGLEGRAGAGHPGAGRPRGPVDDAALHAPEPGGNGGRDPVARRTRPRYQSG